MFYLVSVPNGRASTKNKVDSSISITNTYERCGLTFWERHPTKSIDKLPKVIFWWWWCPLVRPRWWQHFIQGLQDYLWTDRGYQYWMLTGPGTPDWDGAHQVAYLVGVVAFLKLFLYCKLPRITESEMGSHNQFKQTNKQIHFAFYWSWKTLGKRKHLTHAFLKSLKMKDLIPPLPRLWADVEGPSLLLRFCSLQFPPDF